MQVLAFGRYQAGRSMPALMHLPTKVPSGICSASQTMISCVEVIQINTGMELKFRDWNRWRRALFRREGGCPRASGPHQSAPQWRSPLGWRGRWPGEPYTPARCMGSQNLMRCSRLRGVAGSSIPALMNWPTKIASGICSTSQMIISVEAMSTNAARELRFGGVHRNVSPKCRPIALANCPESNHYTNSVSWAVSETYGEITSQAGGSGHCKSNSYTEATPKCRPARSRIPDGGRGRTAA